MIALSEQGGCWGCSMRRCWMACTVHGRRRYARPSAEFTCARSRSNPFEYNQDNPRHARSMTPSDAVVDMLFGTNAGQLHINKFEFYAPRHFCALRNANFDAVNCDMTGRPGEQPSSSGPSLGSSDFGFCS